MKRTAKQRLLLGFALFHLLSDVAFAGGAILCVGPDDHRAIESQHISDVGCQTPATPESAQPDKLAYSGASPAQSGCADSPLHEDAELVSQADDASNIAPALFTSGFPSELTARTPQVVASGVHVPGLSAALRAHRTTVLLI